MSTDGGSVWSEIDNEMSEGYTLALGSLYQGGGDYDGTLGIYLPTVFRSTNDGASWDRYTVTPDRGNVYSLIVHPTNPDIVFAGGNQYYNQTYPYKAMLYKSTNGGADWTNIASTSMKQTSRVGKVTIDPYDHDRILAGSGSGVYVSTNGGSTWQSPGELYYVRALIADPTTANRYFIGSTTGVHVSTNGGINWTPMNDGLVSVDVHCLDFDPVNGMLYAGTESGGVFRYSAGTGIEEDIFIDTLPTAPVLFQNFPNPFNAETEITFHLYKEEYVELVIFNVQGQKIRTLVEAVTSAGGKVVAWDGRNNRGLSMPSGIYIVRLLANDQIFVQKALMQK